MSSQEKGLLTAQEAAKYLAISTRKLWGMKASREIPFVRMGRSVRYTIEDLARFIEGRKEGGSR